VWQCAAGSASSASGSVWQFAQYSARICLTVCGRKSAALRQCAALVRQCLVVHAAMCGSALYVYMHKVAKGNARLPERFDRVLSNAGPNLARAVADRGLSFHFSFWTNGGNYHECNQYDLAVCSMSAPRKM
jgi:hypothetical protein